MKKAAADVNPATRKPGLGCSLGVATVAVLVTVLLLEVFLRATHLGGARLSWSQPDSLIGWRFTPNKAYYHFGENETPRVGRINSLGWRDKERTLKEPPDVYRVAILGDSFVEAFQVEQEATFLALAEEQLSQETGRPVELLNFGRSGMTQSEQYLLLRDEVLQYQPDAVALFFLPDNDIADISRETAGDLVRPFFTLSPSGDLVLDTSFNQSATYRWKQLLNPLKQNSALVSWLAEQANSWRQQRRRPAADVVPSQPMQLGGPWSVATAQPDPQFGENYQLNKRLIEAMAGIAQQHGIQFILVSIGQLYRPEEIAAAQAIDPSYDPAYFDSDLADLAAKDGFMHAGLYEVFRQHYEQNGQPLRWSHWNYAGHEVVAETMADVLRPLVGVEQ